MSGRMSKALSIAALRPDDAPRGYMETALDAGFPNQ
jgi:hypothetical protein